MLKTAGVILFGILAACIVGAGILLYVLFNPVSSFEVPELDKLHYDPAGHFSILVPSGWNAEPLVSGESGLLFLPDGATAPGISEIKVLSREINANAKLDMTLNVYKIEKFWITIYHIAVLGIVDQNRLCSVSTTVLSPQKNIAEDLCKALFKNIRIQATIPS